MAGNTHVLTSRPRKFIRTGQGISCAAGWHMSTAAVIDASLVMSSRPYAIAACETRLTMEAQR